MTFDDTEARPHLENVIPLTFGRRGAFQIQIPTERLQSRFVAPAAVTPLGETLAHALESPLEYPSLRQAVVAGDRVTLAVDRQTPQAETLILGLWKVLESCGVSAPDVTILVPATLTPGVNPDLRRLLPAGVREQVVLKIHDPLDETSTAYLATTAGGERVYLHKDLLDSDLPILIGGVGFDSVLGFRGGGSALYPGLSNVEAIRKAVGQGHDELAPDDSRPLRQMMDEVSWLLGLQFAVQVVPSVGDGVCAVIAGQIDAAYQKARAVLTESWTLPTRTRAGMVIVAVDHDANGHSWSQLGAALDVARQLVSKEGRIVALTELRSDLTPGMQLLREVRSPRDALKPLRDSQPLDMLAASQIAKALDWAGVSLLSGLPGDLVEDLGMLPLDETEELQRLVETEESIAVVQSAQHVHVVRKKSGKPLA